MDKGRGRKAARLGPAAALILATAALSRASGAEIPVYPGCDAPPPNPSGRVFYIDPARGDPSNDGSQAHPWRTLAETADPKSGPIATRGKPGAVRPGDTLMLMSGDHGAVNLSRYSNDAFISVVAAPEQSPVLSLLKIDGASHWLFRGLRFRGEKGTDPAHKYLPLVGLGMGGPAPGDNIVFVGNSFATEESSRDWSDTDWVEKPYVTGFQSKAACVALIDNHFFNLRNAVALSGPRTLAQGNLVERMGNDAFEFNTSDITLRRNTVRDGHHVPQEPLHADGVQGWTSPGATNRNVVIEGNRILNPSQTEAFGLQGISIFDGQWDNVTVENNVVVTNAYHGIALYGVDNAKVVNNTVLPTRPDKVLTWITVRDSKDHRPSRNVIVRNNIAGNVLVKGEALAYDHNVLLRRQNEGANGAAADAPVTAHNVLDPRMLDHFADYDLGAGKFDLRPGRASPAREGGSAQDAPALDIDGRPRTPPYDIGAFAR